MKITVKNHFYRTLHASAIAQLPKLENIEIFQWKIERYKIPFFYICCNKRAVSTEFWVINGRLKHIDKKVKYT